MRFDSIYGQEDTKSYLKNLADQDRIPHAFLFSGPQGNGKLAMALAFASYILCTDHIDGDSCGNCAACNKSFQHIHPDLHYVIPTHSVNGKSTPSSEFYEDWREMLKEGPYFTLESWAHKIKATRNINIPKVSIMQLINSFGLKTFEGRKKIGIIWQGELMGHEGNRLLKLIEEPPENSVFIILSEDVDRILNTIISRCQIVNIAPFKDEELLQFAHSKFKLGEERLKSIVHLANGNMIELNELVQNTNDELNKQFFKWLRLSFQAKALEIEDWSNHFNKQKRDNQRYFYKYGLIFFKQYLRSFSMSPSHLRLSPEAMEIASNMKAVIDENKTLKIINVLNDCIINIERNANVKLQMINTSLTLHKIMVNNQA